MSRTATVTRTTRETDITVTLTLDGSGQADVQTGLGFLDHMLDSLARHGRLDLNIAATGDLHIDDHHTVEDEALARCAVDLSGRPYAVIDLGFTRERLGEVATENLTHFFRSLATAGRLNLHLTLLAGENDHHRAEAAFKATAVALRRAVAVTGDAVPSTKGVL